MTKDNFVKFCLIILGSIIFMVAMGEILLLKDF